ncbi:uncharacterized protein B0I36DRAFT_346589 [Microdochium trichocladiopsis]|uniref:Histone chaperone domain-containing protein n=1 Tax=Microdochium trichocladiopsis TaxID=1682393 RepID=A0A9P8YA92_9PEZI|nr:uncharacterized protein B0I36DRAFT_346589 [Microdochium trichocladiopsis]KAH7034686.1 hypothetical protein B0I36DRAFT_346589 [Microdochium trichocladiopsis]
MSSENAPSGEYSDESYVSRTGQKQGPIPVTSDREQVEDPINPETADSDEQLERDDADAIDESNVIDERTRGAKPRGTYREPGDEEGLPTDDGTSSADVKSAE